ncbi:MAG: glycosyltransferase [Oscillospiraceae bacterium]|jgi:glycosyltransferase involved in cell wall biosynthesis|nr:glycosyltransferase [Oscillospiraceae bacterium]
MNAEKRNLLLINTVCGGSHGRIMGDLCAAAGSAGFAAHVAFGRGENRFDGIRISGRFDVLRHVARTRLLDGHALGSKRATRALIAEMRRHPPALVHLHNLHGYYLHAPALFDYFKETGVPVIWTLHDCWALTGHCSHFVRANCDKWQTGCFDCPLKSAYPASQLLDASRANWRWKRDLFTDLPNLTIVCPSKWLGEVVGQSYLQHAPRRVISSGVDLGLFVPPMGDVEAIREAHGVQEGQLMLLAVAAPFDERKGFADALAVAGRLGRRARLVLVGLTDAQRRALPREVTGICRTEGPEALVALYGAADCLINPTYEDTYPTVNMEAMACGTPVAAYAVGGCTEQLESPVGRAVPVGDAAALAEAALALALQKADLAADCRRYAQQHFDRQAAIAQYIRLYLEKMGEYRP